jgi:hypothetical protein
MNAGAANVGGVSGCALASGGLQFSGPAARRR